ncbi:hypothetical protein B0H14DRAFT_3518323 [Mycena olivaceomarginata]|nr:hypothetical protein B0H14DRAFT_3518323 [Mycena olivaceomarginata]
MSLSGLFSSHAALDMRRTSFRALGRVDALRPRDAPFRAAIWPCRAPPHTIGLVARSHPISESRTSLRQRAKSGASHRRQSPILIRRLHPGHARAPLLYLRAGLGAPEYALGQDLPASSPVRAGDERHAWEGGDVPAGMRRDEDGDGDEDLFRPKLNLVGRSSGGGYTGREEWGQSRRISTSPSTTAMATSRASLSFRLYGEHSPSGSIEKGAGADSHLDSYRTESVSTHASWVHAMCPDIGIVPAVVMHSARLASNHCANRSFSVDPRARLHEAGWLQ